MGSIDFKKVVIAGLAGSAAMAVIMFLAPMMGVSKMDMGVMLGRMNPMVQMPYLMGWVLHFIVGIILTWIYAAFLLEKLPSDGWKRGMVYSLIPWAALQIIMMPMMMGKPMFSGGDMMALLGTLVAHLVYGGVMGGIYGDGAVAQAAAAAPTAEPTATQEPTPEPTPEPEPEPEPTPEPEAEAAPEVEHHTEEESSEGSDSGGEDEGAEEEKQE